jgi:hypothetical protein
MLYREAPKSTDEETVMPEPWIEKIIHDIQEKNHEEEALWIRRTRSTA